MSAEGRRSGTKPVSTARNLLGLLLSVALVFAFVLLAMAVGSIGPERPQEPEPVGRLTNQTYTGTPPTTPAASAATPSED